MHSALGVVPLGDDGRLEGCLQNDLQAARIPIGNARAAVGGQEGQRLAQVVQGVLPRLTRGLDRGWRFDSRRHAFRLDDAGAEVDDSPVGEPQKVG